MDRNTADAIFHRLFSSDGLLQRRGSTIVMTTHSGITQNLSRLFLEANFNKARYIELANQIVLIEDGCVRSISKSRDVLIDGQEDITGFLSVVSEEDIEKTKAVELSQKVPKESCVAPNDESSIRKRGDFSLYSFYLNSTTKWLWAAWLLAVALVAVAERLPGK